MLTKKEKKAYVFKHLDALLKPLGYKALKTGEDPRYILENEYNKYRFYLNFSNMGDLYFSKYDIAIKEVEDIIEEIGSPINTSHLDSNRYFSDTVTDTSENPYLYEVIETQEQLELFTNWMLSYLQNEGKHFIETYSYLPNILKRMDELMETKGYWSDILTGGVPHLFKGLIISKLCNDPNFNNKVSFVDNLFATENISEFLPYYEKLKERLKSVEPKYTI